jgi:hypothetical protein
MNFKSEFLTNKWVLNIVVVLSILNIIGYISLGNLNAVLFYILFAVLIRYFSKNMTIVLGVPLIIINLFYFKGTMIEGMDNKDDEKRADMTKDDEKKDNKKETDTSNTTGTKEDTTQQGFEAGRRKNKGHNIDYATTVEDAYDDLNNKLGTDGIQRLTADTQKLIEKQAKLAKTMEGMSKLVENIQPVVGQLQKMISPSK